MVVSTSATVIGRVSSVRRLRAQSVQSSLSIVLQMSLCESAAEALTSATSSPPRMAKEISSVSEAESLHWGRVTWRAFELPSHRVIREIEDLIRLRLWNCEEGALRISPSVSSDSLVPGGPFYARLKGGGGDSGTSIPETAAHPQQP